MNDVAAAFNPSTPEANLFASITPHPNDKVTETATPDQSSIVEKVKLVAKGVFEKHNVLFKRGGGRPRKDGQPNKLDVPLNAPSTALPAGLAPGAATPAADGLDPVLIKRCCSALIKATRGFFDKVLFSKARSAGHTVSEAQQLVVDTTITQEEMDGFTDLAEVCLRKYGVGSQYLPEIGLTVIVLGVGVRYTVAIRGLEEKAAQVPDNQAPPKGQVTQ